MNIFLWYPRSIFFVAIRRYISVNVFNTAISCTYTIIKFLIFFRFVFINFIKGLSKMSYDVVKRVLPIAMLEYF